MCGGSLTHRLSAGGHLWSQQWEDQRCWPQHSRTDVCTAHYTCSSSLLHPSSLHTETHTQNNQCSSHACRLFGISNCSVEKCRLLPILMMCTTIYTSFLRSPLPRSWIKHQRQLISTDYSAWLLLQRFHLNTHHKKCALSFSLLGKLGQTVFIEFNKEPFTAKQTERTREMLSVYTVYTWVYSAVLKMQLLESSVFFKSVRTIYCMYHFWHSRDNAVKFPLPNKIFTEQNLINKTVYHNRS